MSTKTGQAIVTIGEDYGNALIGTDDTQAQMSFALFKMMDSGRPWYSWDVLHNYFANVYQPQGIGMIPWTVVRGFSNEGAHEEGRQAGIYSTAVQGCILMDLEDDPKDYWQGIDSAVDAYIEGFKEGGGREIYLWPDTRAGHLAGINFDHWWKADVVTRVWPQAYFAMFYNPGPGRPKRGIDASVQPMLDHGVPANAITPTLMTSDAVGNPISWAELLEGILYCKEIGMNGFALWRREFLSIEQRDGLAALDDPWAPPAQPIPEPTPSPIPPVSELKQAASRLQAATIELQTVSEEVVRLAGV